MLGEDGSVIAPPQLKIAPWADEEGLGLTDYKTGRARVLTPDRRAALTLRCLPLPVEVGRLIEAHPNEVRVPCGQGPRACAAVVEALAALEERW